MAADFRQPDTTPGSLETRRLEIVKEALRQTETCLYTSTMIFIWLRDIRRHHQFFVAVPIVLGALATFTVLEEALPAWIIALLALLASLFPALADGLKIQTSVDEAARLGAEYKALQDRFRRLARITALGEVDNAEASLAELMDRLDVARSTSMTPPQRYYEEARRQIKAGNYDFTVDLATGDTPSGKRSDDNAPTGTEGHA